MANAYVGLGPVGVEVDVMSPAEAAVWFGPNKTWYPMWGTGRFWSLGSTLWAELIGMTMFVFVSGFANMVANISGEPVVAALARGFVWALIFYGFRRYSAGDCNPALSLTRFWFGSINGWQLLVLWIGQTGGTFLGGLINWAIFDDIPGYGSLGACQAFAFPGLLNESRIAGLEGTGSVILFALVVLTEGMWFQGILAGLTLTGLVSFFFPYTSGCFNPYLHLGPAVLADSDFEEPVGWAFYGAPFLATVAAWIIVILLAPETRRLAQAEKARRISREVAEEIVAERVAKTV